MFETGLPLNDEILFNIIMNLNYIDYLKDELTVRKSGNPLYSLRAFARDLEVSPSTLSEVMAGKHHLSLRTAQKLVEKLKISEEDKKNFLDLVAVESQASKADIEKRVARIKQRLQSFDKKMPLDLFKVISDWQHFAILELTKIKGFQASISWVADCLGLEESEIQVSVERLVRINALIIHEDRWEVSDEYANNFVGYDIPSEAIKKFHRQCMQKVFEKLTLPMEVREYSSTLMALNKNEYESIKKQIKKFKSESFSLVKDEEEKDELYLLGIQLVPVSHNYKES